MSDPANNLPRWVAKPDGRLTPFDPDLIHRTLYAATESLGQPDPFLARELTDSVLHFLTAEADDPISTAQLADLVTKVVRELGQPVLAQAFERCRANGHPEKRPAEIRPAVSHEHIEAFADPLELVRELAAPSLREYSLSAVFGPELVAAHQDGLLILTGLEHPFELAAGVVDPAADRLLPSILEARSRVGQVLVLDGPEFLAGSPTSAIQELSLGLQATGLWATVNLNLAAPPRWAMQAAEGPLFAGQGQRRGREELDQLADRWLDSSLGSRIRLDWHLGERDFRADLAPRLLQTARRAVEGSIAFVFDRPRREPALAEGIDRRHPAVLLYAGLNLPRLAARTGRGDASQFLGKLRSLARLAISAAAQKRDFLRRQRPALASGFLLDRARLVAVPVGLEEAAQILHGDAASLDFARSMIQELNDVLKRECAGRQLESTVDSPGIGLFEQEPAGLTLWHASASLRQQLQAAGKLQAVTESGTARLTTDRRITADELADFLRYAWQHTEIVRLMLHRPEPPALDRKLVED